MKLMLVPPPLVMEKLLKAHAVMPRPPEESNPVPPKTKPADCPGAQLALVSGLKLLSGSRTSDEPLVMSEEVSPYPAGRSDSGRRAASSCVPVHCGGAGGAGPATTTAAATATVTA